MNRTISQLLITEPKKNKNKLSKQLEQEQNHRNGDHIEGYGQGGGEGRMGGTVQGIRSLNGRYKIRQGTVKNSIGNGEAKELICTTYVHELSGGIAGGREWSGRKGIKERKKMGQL